MISKSNSRKRKEEKCYNAPRGSKITQFTAFVILSASEGSLTQKEYPKLLLRTYNVQLRTNAPEAYSCEEDTQ